MPNNPAERQPTFYAASYLILQRGDEILMLHRKNTGWMDSYWGLPAGHIEGAEGVAAAVLREAKEEAGIELTEEDLTLKHVMHRSTDRVYFDFFFTAAGEGVAVKNTEPDKHDELKWFKVSELPGNTIPYLKRVISRIQKGELFSEDVTM